MLAILVLLAINPGCAQRESGRNAAQSSDAAPPNVRTAQAEPAADEGIWEALYLQGSKIGYSHTTSRTLERDGEELLETHSKNHLEIKRFGQLNVQDLTLELLETPEGDLLEFKTQLRSGGQPSTVTGRAEGSRMAITAETQGQRVESGIPWSSDIRGFRAVEQSLAREPMEPGEQRSFKMLMPLLDEVAQTELAALDYETTRLLGVEARLLRVEAVARLPDGQSINSTLWTDASGEVIKTRVAALGQESFRTTRSLAMAPGDETKSLDLGFGLIVKVDPPLAKPHKTHEVRYRVELERGDPSETFAKGPTQTVRSAGPHAAEVTVQSLRPADVQQRADAAADVGPEYTSASSVLQIDDPQIRRMAEEAKGDATDPVDVAVALERYVHGAVTEKNFSQAFATAAEVAQSREGDCTEHAVLLAALARACGIPSRVAIGLVYVEPSGGFGYHMWTELYLRGVWVPFDATLGQGGTSAAYLKLTDSSLAGASAYSSFLAVANVLGQLNVSVLDAK